MLRMSDASETSPDGENATGPDDASGEDPAVPAAASPGPPPPSVPQIQGAPPLRWLGAGGQATFAGDLTMTAGPETDWFNDPTGARLASAPALVFPAEGDCQLSARVSVDFQSTFDAGVLFVHQSEDDYAKLCLEYSPDFDPMVVSVVTRGTSDDANGPALGASSAHLRISRVGDMLAFHYSTDGDWWKLNRLFQLRDPGQPTSFGFFAQSPNGTGCTATFADISFTDTTLDDPRDGN